MRRMDWRPSSLTLSCTSAPPWNVTTASRSDEPVPEWRQGTMCTWLRCMEERAEEKVTALSAISLRRETKSCSISVREWMNEAGHFSSVECWLIVTIFFDLLVVEDLFEGDQRDSSATFAFDLTRKWSVMKMTCFLRGINRFSEVNCSDAIESNSLIRLREHRFPVWHEGRSPTFKTITIDPTSFLFSSSREIIWHWTGLLHCISSRSVKLWFHWQWTDREEVKLCPSLRGGPHHRRLRDDSLSISIEEWRCCSKVREQTKCLTDSDQWSPLPWRECLLREWCSFFSFFVGRLTCTLMSGKETSSSAHLSPLNTSNKHLTWRNLFFPLALFSQVIPFILLPTNCLCLSPSRPVIHHLYKTMHLTHFFTLPFPSHPIPSSPLPSLPLLSLPHPLCYHPR